jgi:hypothetical protein
MASPAANCPRVLDPRNTRQSEPFSAEYDKLGYGRIEILTKPGTDSLHGRITVNGSS